MGKIDFNNGNGQNEGQTLSHCEELRSAQRLIDANIVTNDLFKNIIQLNILCFNC
jgi:hypothetical protein